ncbi:MAG: ABC transporter permease [bacterium]|nr:ABC transporter permease [bacterium]
MIWGYLLKLVSKNMWRHRLRTTLTMLGIMVAIVSFGLLRTVVDSWYAGAEATSSAGRLITRNAISLSFPLPLTYAEKIRQLPGVDTVTWGNWFGGIYINEKNFFAQLAVDADSYFRVYDEYAIAPAQLKAFQLDRGSCIIGRKLADKYHFRIGDQIPLRGTIYPGIWTFTVRGIYEAKSGSVDTSQMFMHWSYLNERVRKIMPGRANSVGVYVINIKHPGEAAKMSALVDSTFRNSLAETRTETQKAFQLSFVAMVDTILMAIEAVAYVVIIIIMAVMANTMAMTARERTSEYATLKALGFPDRFIMLLILGESMAISLVGGLLGIIATFPIANSFYLATGKIFAVFYVAPETVWLQVGAAVLVGIVAALTPAWSSTRINITDGLRAVA